MLKKGGSEALLRSYRFALENLLLLILFKDTVSIYNKTAIHFYLYFFIIMSMLKKNE
jgi:hypothetical protein